MLILETILRARLATATSSIFDGSISDGLLDYIVGCDLNQLLVAYIKLVLTSFVDRDLILIFVSITGLSFICHYCVKYWLLINANMLCNRPHLQRV